MSTSILFWPFFLQTWKWHTSLIALGICRKTCKQSRWTWLVRFVSKKGHSLRMTFDGAQWGQNIYKIVVTFWAPYSSEQAHVLFSNVSQLEAPASGSSSEMPLGFQIRGWTSSNVVSIICPLVVIGLTELSSSGCAKQSCRWVFKSGWASSNVVGIICPPGCNRVNWTPKFRVG